MTLSADMTAASTDDGVELVLTVTNDGDEDVELSFPDACQADFAALNDDGESVWRWSEGQLFAQMLTSETVPAGGSVTYTQQWPDPPVGEWVLVGEVPARNVELEARTTVSV